MNLPPHNLRRMDGWLRQAGVEAAGRLSGFAEIDSTSAWLVQQPDAHGRVCLAEHQTAGRGRRGQAWRAAPSSSVLLSIGWRLGAASVAGLSLLSGLAAVAGLRGAGIEAVGLKWPNDLMADGKKLGGVLTEVVGEHCIIGVGINVAMRSGWGAAAESDSADSDAAADAAAAAESESSAIDQPWTDLKSLGYDLDRDALAASVIIAHCHYLRRFCGRGFSSFAAAWNRLNVHRGQRVSVRLPQESFTGAVLGVADDGALMVDHHGAPRRIISGAARIRPLEQTVAGA